MSQEFQHGSEAAGSEAAESTDDEDEEEQEDLTLSFEDTASLMRPTHCLVYYTAPGRTLRDKNVLLLDVNARFFTLRYFIVGVSRATAGLRLGIATHMQREELMRQNTVTVRPNPIRLRFGERYFLE